MKNIFLTIAAFFMLSQIAAQTGDENDSITIFINAKTAAQYVFKPGDAATVFTVKKADTKNLKQLQIQVKGPLVTNTRYARALEVGENNTIAITETKDHPGHFDIVNAAFKKLFLSGKKVPLYLMLSPANPMLMIPSKRIFLGTLMLK
jgi:hypothetical protein